MKAAGFDWLFIDLEHGSMSIETACEISVAAQDFGIAPIVRVPYGELTMATRVLDGGALGIVIPHVDTAEEAKEIADRLRYPPRGHRSVGGGQAQFDYAPMPLGEMTRRSRRQHADHGDDRDAQGGRECRGDRGRPGHRLPARGLERPVDGDGHPGRHRQSQGPGRRRQGRSPPARSTASGRAWAAPTPRSCSKIYTDKGMKFLLAGNDLPMLTARRARTRRRSARSEVDATAPSS